MLCISLTFLFRNITVVSEPQSWLNLWEILESNNMAITLNEVIRMQQMMIDVGEKLIHSTIGNPNMIATNVESLGANWRAYQSLGHGI